MNEPEIAEHVANVGPHPLIITHAHCADGWCAWMLARRRWPDAEVLECVYGDEVGRDEEPNVFTFWEHSASGKSAQKEWFDFAGRDVIVLDFSFPREVLQSMRGQARSLLVLDHHKTAKTDLDGLDYCVFDVERSGAGLALDVFFPGHRTKEHAWATLIPRGGGVDGQEDWHWSYLARLVEDRDLWRFKLDGSKEINAALGILPRTIEAWEGIMRIANLEDEGRAMLKMQAALVERIADHAREVEWFAGVEAVTCNASCLQSEVGEFLYGKHPERVICVWYRHEDGQIAGSLRSSPTGPDVSLIAKRFDGGGHAHAAGFRCDDEREIVEGRSLRDPRTKPGVPSFPMPRVSG